MGNLTKNLSRSEFACTCGCGFDTVDFELVEVLQGAVDFFANKYSEPCYIIISGPNRCPCHNDECGGAANSQHINGKAADHKIFKRLSDEPILPREMYEYYDTQYPDSLGVGWYHNRVHVDSRATKARWGK